jgi:hypothetical protein
MYGKDFGCGHSDALNFCEFFICTTIDGGANFAPPGLSLGRRRAADREDPLLAFGGPQNPRCGNYRQKSLNRVGESSLYRTVC